MKGSPHAPLTAAQERRSEPLAARMRPRTLDEFVGQQQLLGPGTPLRTEIESGPWGRCCSGDRRESGKTTLGRLVAQYTDREFVPFSAVTEGVPRVRVIVGEAEAAARGGRGTVLFVDEIHRFNRAQQDAFLQYVENGTLTLIGATTENPSFEINGALLSRLRVFVLAATGRSGAGGRWSGPRCRMRDRGLGAMHLTIEDAALDTIVTEADGDARRALDSARSGRIVRRAPAGRRRRRRDYRGRRARCDAGAGGAVRQVG